MLGFPLPNPRAVATPPFCDCQWGKNRLFCFKIRDLSMGQGIKNNAQSVAQRIHLLRLRAARRMICKRLGNDKTAQTSIGNLGNRKKVRP